MKLISFDLLRTLQFPPHLHLKPGQIFQHKQALEEADWVLYPEHWQLNALAYALKCNIFPSLQTYTIGHNKIEMTRVFESLVPAHTPLTRIHGNTPERAHELWETFATPFVAKIPKASMGEGVFLINNYAEWQGYCAISDVLYVQEYLPIDRDLRLVVIGDKVVSSYWRLQSHNGFHNNIARGGQIVEGDIPQTAIDLVETVAQQLGINHAGFDVAMVDNYPYLLEFNRLFGTRGPGCDAKRLSGLILDYLQARLNDFDPTFPGVPVGRTGRRMSVAQRRVA